MSMSLFLQALEIPLGGSKGVLNSRTKWIEMSKLGVVIGLETIGLLCWVEFKRCP